MIVIHGIASLILISLGYVAFNSDEPFYISQRVNISEKMIGASMILLAVLNLWS